MPTPRKRASTADEDLLALRGLVECLSECFAGRAGAWRPLVDIATLRRFLDELDECDAFVNSRGAARDAAGDERVRSLCSELLVAARLLESGCAIEHEIAGPSGKRVDFRARRDGAILDIHVKRAPRPTLHDQPAAVPGAWRELESVARGLTVAISLSRALRGAALGREIARAADFLAQASIGEELALVDREGRTAGRLRVIAPSGARRVELVPDPSQSFDDHVPRFQSTLRKAFAQFTPRQENLIVVCGSAGGFEAFATALLGSHIERWDRRPRRGELVAYGRGGDGFWAGSLRNQSRAAVYWTLAADAAPLLFVREGAPATRGMALARAVFA